MTRTVKILLVATLAAATLVGPSPAMEGAVLVCQSFLSVLYTC